MKLPPEQRRKYVSLPNLNSYSSCILVPLQLQARNRWDGTSVQGGGLEEPILWGRLGNRQVDHSPKKKWRKFLKEAC